MLEENDKRERGLGVRRERGVYIELYLLTMRIHYSITDSKRGYT